MHNGWNVMYNSIGVIKCDRQPILKSAIEQNIILFHLEAMCHVILYL